MKLSVDRLDPAFDRQLRKRTVPVVLGDCRGGLVPAGFQLLVAFGDVGLQRPSAD